MGMSRSGSIRHTLDDGDAIANHDALSTAIKAAQLAASQAPPAQNGVPKLIDVYHQMLNLNTLNPVPGASGDLTYQFRGDEGEDSGNPCNKPISIREVPPYKPPPILAGTHSPPRHRPTSRPVVKALSNSRRVREFIRASQRCRGALR
jgi:hypothetical protein